MYQRLSNSLDLKAITPTKELKSFAYMPNVGHMYLSNKHCFSLSSIGQSRRNCTGTIIQTEFALKVPYSHKYNLQT